MAARLAVGLDPRDRLLRLATLFAVELRLKIVAELYIREMSAKQFFAAYGGGSLSRVHKNFEVLAKEGWLSRTYSEGPGGSRRGGVEQFFRATEPPIVHAECWALIPYSVRVSASMNLFKQIAPRLRGDIEKADESALPKRDLTCSALLLDQEGWTRVTKVVSALFAQLFEEQEDARRRVLHTGAALMRGDIFLITFQSADSGARSALRDGLIAERPQEPLGSFPEHLAPILRDEIRRDILSALNDNETSVTQFYRDFDGASKPMISRRFKSLEGSGWTTKGRQMTGGVRRGAIEQFYRPTIPRIGTYDPCLNADRTLVESDSWTAFGNLCEEIKEAMMVGAFDARIDRFLTWSLIHVDRQGWESVISGVESLYDLILLEQGRAMKRMAKSGEKPIRMTVGLGAFEALKESVKAP